MAMQDLDIRGAGNMLGAEQSGFISDLGYETYQKILSEAVNELKNEEFSDIYRDSENSEKLEGSDFVQDVTIESDLELLFPAGYIPSDSERITIYRELDNIEDETELVKFKLKLEDRFGKIPKEGLELISVVNLRRLAKQLGLEKVVLKRGVMNMFLVSNPDSPYYQSKAFDKLLTYIQKHPKNCELKEKNGKRSITIKDVPNIETACYILNEIKNIE